MRAKEIIARLSLEEIRKLADAIGSASDAVDVARTMQGPDAYEIATRASVSAVMREDLMLLCANPFDNVSADELADPSAFEAIGLIVSTGDDAYAVNADMALAAAAHCSVEFGFAATLISRLDPEELAVVAKAMEVGPRPSVIDTILDAAETLASDTTVMKHVAFLKNDEREVLRQALELGELPDDLENFPLDSSPPLVTLDNGEAGRRGLVYWVTHEASGVDARPVVPLEVAEFLPRILEQVPPPPEVVASKSRRRRTSSASRRTAPKKEAASSPAPAAAPGAVQQADQRARDPFARPDRSGSTRNPFLSKSGASRRIDASSSGVFKRTDSLSGSSVTGPFASSGSSSPYRLGKVTGIQAASAIIDVETAKVAAAVKDDAELAESVLEIVADSLVVLRPGVDAQKWAETCALRLGL